MKRRSITALFTLLALGIGSGVFGQTTAFKYQGSLQNSSAPANGNFDFEFLLFDAASGGTQVGSTLTRSSVAVAAGSFAVDLDFGSQFPGANRFLEIHVRPAGGGAFTPLAPRQSVGSSPYSIQSLNAANALNATNATNATNSTNATNAVNATNFTGNLTGDVTGTQGATVVSKVGGQIAANVGSSTQAVTAATSNNTPNTLVKRDGSGNFIAGIITGNLTGNAATATNATQLGGVAASQYVLTGDARMTDARNPLPSSPNYIQNTNTAQAANFNVSGTGTADTFNAATQFNLGGGRILSNSGIHNFFAGVESGATGFGGNDNSLFGYKTGTVSTGSFNSFFGSSVGQANQTGSNNSFFGYFAGLGNTSGGSNSFFGEVAGGNNVTGGSNTMIGYKADVTVPGLTNATAIGANAVVGGDNKMVLGSIAGINGATSDVNVGIGTTTPGLPLEVRSATNSAISGNSIVGNGVEGHNNGTGGSGVGVWGTSTSISGAGVYGSGPVGVRGGTTASGGVGIVGNGTSWFRGDSTPLNTALVGTGTGVAIGSSTDLGYIFAIDYSTFTSKILALNSPGGRVGIGTLAPDQTLSVNGNASKSGGGSWLTFSDRRLKNIKGRYAPGLAAVMRLQPLLYEYKNENALGIRSDGIHVGFSAQDVEQVIPEAVTKNEQGYRLVNNDPIMLAMLNAIKEQEAQIELLQKQINQQNAANKNRQVEIGALKALVCARNRRSAVCKPR